MISHFWNSDSQCEFIETLSFLANIVLEGFFAVAYFWNFIHFLDYYKN